MALATLLACHPVNLATVCTLPFVVDGRGPQNSWPRDTVRFGFLFLFGHQRLVPDATARPQGPLALVGAGAAATPPSGAPPK